MKLLIPAILIAVLAALSIRVVVAGRSALGDGDLSSAARALAELDRVGITRAASVLSRLRQHVDRYEYEEANVIATQLLEQIDGQVP